jgi:hypothetical protein
MEQQACCCESFELKYQRCNWCNVTCRVARPLLHPGVRGTQSMCMRLSFLRMAFLRADACAAAARHAAAASAAAASATATYCRRKCCSHRRLAKSCGDGQRVGGPNLEVTSRLTVTEVRIRLGAARILACARNPADARNLAV